MIAAPPIVAPWRKRRRRAPAIPRELRKEITKHTRAIAKEYRKNFEGDHKLKDRATRLVRTLLPPQPKRRGRPRDPQITRAIRLHSKFRRQYPAEKPREIWSQVCRVLFPAYAGLSELEQRDMRQDLLERVRSRLQRRRRQGRRPRSQETPTQKYG